jgi:hypothetical protein
MRCVARREQAAGARRGPRCRAAGRHHAGTPWSHHGRDAGERARGGTGAGAAAAPRPSRVGDKAGASRWGRRGRAARARHGRGGREGEGGRGSRRAGADARRGRAAMAGPRPSRGGEGEGGEEKGRGLTARGGVRAAPDGAGELRGRGWGSCAREREGEILGRREG